MVEVLAVNRKVLRVGGTDYPYQLVKNRFLCIGQDHVEYVLHCLEQTASRIGNIKAYILTTLFNATATMDTYYTMWLWKSNFGTRCPKVRKKSRIRFVRRRVDILSALFSYQEG